MTSDELGEGGNQKADRSTEVIINLNVCVSFLMRSGDVHSPSVQNVIKNAARPQNLEAEPF